MTLINISTERDKYNQLIVTIGKFKKPCPVKFKNESGKLIEIISDNILDDERIPFRQREIWLNKYTDYLEQLVKQKIAIEKLQGYEMTDEEICLGYQRQDQLTMFGE